MSSLVVEHLECFVFCIISSAVIIALRGVSLFIFMIVSLGIPKNAVVGSKGVYFFEAFDTYLQISILKVVTIYTLISQEQACLMYQISTGFNLSIGQKKNCDIYCFCLHFLNEMGSFLPCSACHLSRIVKLFIFFTSFYFLMPSSFDY